MSRHPWITAAFDLCPVLFLSYEDHFANRRTFSQRHTKDFRKRQIHQRKQILLNKQKENKQTKKAKQVLEPLVFLNRLENA